MSTELAEATRARLRPRWWRELIYIGAFYLVYSFVRNLQGQGEEQARNNGERIISWEKTLGIYHEHGIQNWFGIHPGAEMNHLHWHTFIQFWNMFYGTAHFIVTVVALVWLFRLHPDRYPLWRNTLAFTTLLALFGFMLFPLMPPRLIGDGFVDTLAEIGGLWSFESGPVHEVSNQFAAMPSLHFAWAAWCMLVFLPSMKRPWSRALAISYPLLTLFAIVVTANHYFLDAVGGALVLAMGFVLGRALTEAWVRRAEAAEAAEAAVAPAEVPTTIPAQLRANAPTAGPQSRSRPE